MAEAKSEDRMVSELPDDLLVKILGHVPTKDAVATMILSKRWVSIWTLVRILWYKEIEDDDESKKSVWWFLNKSLELHKAPVIEALHMELGPRCPADVDVGKWVVNAVDRLVKRLKLYFLWSADPTSLPNTLYSCQSLVELTLSHQILIDVPSSVCLPSLIDLQLDYVLYKDEDSLLSFLSSCPILEFLTVSRKRYDNLKNFAVKVPSLWELSYSNYSSATDGCLVVDAPAMNSFSICDFSGVSCSFEDMPFLEEAEIDLVSSHDDDKFLTSFSSVLSLHLYLSDAMVMFMRCTTINFSRLIKLSIYPSKPGWLEPLVLLLANTPNLKELLVDYEYVYGPEDLPFSWNEPSPVPGCLSSQLETFEWRKYGDRIEEEEFLTYILANSKRLKTVTVSLRPTIDLEEQELIIEELTDIPRVSTTSRLLFN